MLAATNCGYPVRFYETLDKCTRHDISRLNTWLTELVHDLKQVSPAFREWWSLHDVQGVQAEHKHLIHPLVGLLVLQAKTFQVADYPDLQMIVYTPVSRTGTAAKLAVLSEPLSAE